MSIWAGRLSFRLKVLAIKEAFVVPVLVPEGPNVYGTSTHKNLKAPDERNVCSLGILRSGARNPSPHMLYEYLAALGPRTRFICIRTSELAARPDDFSSGGSAAVFFSGKLSRATPLAHELVASPVFARD